MSSRKVLTAGFFILSAAAVLYLLQLVAGPFPLPNPFYKFGVPPIMWLQPEVNTKIDSAIRGALEREPASSKIELLEKSGFKCYRALPEYMRCDFNQPYMFPFVTRHLIVILNNDINLSVKSVRVSGSGP